MRKSTISKMLVVTMLLSTLFIPMGGNRAIASDDPDVTIIQSTNEPTNQDVVITVETSDDLSGIREIILPDGSKSTESKITYIVSENGSYTFKAIDNASNETVGIVEITNIFKEKPKLTLTPSTTEPTNQDIVVDVKATGRGIGIKEIVLPDETKIEGDEAQFKVTENGSYTFKAIDVAGNEVEETIEITNIDKVLPVITIEPYETNWTNKDIAVKATVNKGTLNQESYIFTENGSFTFIATDEYGNMVEKVITINNIDKIKPKMKIIVGK
ncbi:hypothetical protein [Xylanivirga thermophila]|uniref:hypothetical protein n=1 Tax=Xylanivirga thermophila TaxID=2496273 RepID=UPI00101B950A|nr:hypothetical protein [Xylanivirga thermophila]